MFQSVHMPLDEVPRDIRDQKTNTRQISYRCFYLIIWRDKMMSLSTAFSIGTTVHSPGDNDWTKQRTIETLAENLAPVPPQFPH